MSEIVTTQEVIVQAVGMLFQYPKQLSAKEAREYLEEEITKAISSEKVVQGAPFVSIKMPCGESVAYQNYEDIPLTNVPCSCGNPKHWFVKYEVINV